MTGDLQLLEQTLLALAAIGAPTGREGARADFICAWLGQQGVTGVGRDEMHNVWVQPTAPGPWRLFDAHTDIVFPDETLTVTKDGSAWRAPGIKDNTAACAMLMVLAREMAAGEVPPHLLTFTVGEEGRGDLKGIKEMVRRFGPEIRDAWVIDGSRDHGTWRAVGSSRYRILFRGPGGHSWNDFGAPSALHAAAAFAAGLESLAPWENGRLTYNIGEISGGVTINTIAPEATLLLDLRALDPEALAAATRDVGASLDNLRQRTAMKIEIEQIGFRPPGAISDDHPLVCELQAVHHQLNLPLAENTLSTNANWLLHSGIPAICTGIVSGANVHSREEYLECDSLALGWQKLLTLATS